MVTVSTCKLYHFKSTAFYSIVTWMTSLSISRKFPKKMLKISITLYQQLSSKFKPCELLTGADKKKIGARGVCFIQVTMEAHVRCFESFFFELASATNGRTNLCLCLDCDASRQRMPLTRTPQPTKTLLQTFKLVIPHRSLLLWLHICIAPAPKVILRSLSIANC